MKTSMTLAAFLIHDGSKSASFRIFYALACIVVIMMIVDSILTLGIVGYIEQRPLLKAAYITSTLIFYSSYVGKSFVGTIVIVTDDFRHDNL